MRLNIKQRLTDMEERRKQPTPTPTANETRHTCRHCGHEYTGRKCPQCGMDGEWTRFTWKQLVADFLDVVGIENRPIGRTIGHLLWRPGYMIREYLAGHYLNYFQPFKTLALLVAVLALTVWGLGIEVANNAELAEKMQEAMKSLDSTPPIVQTLFEGLQNIRMYFAENTLYRLLLQVVFLVTAVWIVFRKRGLNMVETFIAMVYISCQMQVVTILWLLLTRSPIREGLMPYALPELLVQLLLIYDFRQLYGLRFWPAVWRTLLVDLLLAALYAVAIILIALIFVTIVAVTMS